MKNLKKLISVILAVMMIMPTLPVGVFASIGGTSSSIPEGAILLFEENFDSGYTVDQNWMNDTNIANAATAGLTGGTKNYATADNKWHIQANGTPTDDFVGVVDGSAIGGNFSGNALRIFNSRATAMGTGYTAFRRNFTKVNETSGLTEAVAIDLENGEYAGKKLVYEADVRFKTHTGASSSLSLETPFFAPSRKTTIYDYADDSYHLSVLASGRLRLSQGGGDWAASNGPVALWFRQPQAAYNNASRAVISPVKYKVVHDQTGDIDTVRFYINGALINDTNTSYEGRPYPAALNGHPYSTNSNTDFTVYNFGGAQVDFTDEILGVWGSANKCDIYIDNFKAYLIDEFEVSQVTANSTAFDPAVDTVDFTFTNKIDEATVSNDRAVLLDNAGNEVTDGIVSVALKSGDPKTLQVEITETVAGNTSYKVALKDGLKDIYGYQLERDYVYYEYPINVYYTAGADGTYTIGSKSSVTYIPKETDEQGNVTKRAILRTPQQGVFVDGYVAQMTSTKTSATFTTCTLLEYESALPANNSITEYVQGQDQEIVLTFNDDLAAGVDIANAFEVKDEGGYTVTGLAATFGDDRKTVKLQLKDLVLGEGKHTIASKPNALFNASNKFANITYSFDTLDFTATVSETDFDYLPTTEKNITVTLSLPTALTADNIATAFEAKDARGETVDGLGVSLDDTGKIITLSLEDLDISKGSCTINSTSALADSRGRIATAEVTFDIIEFSATASESSGFQIKPGENKVVTVTLSRPTTLTADNISTGFAVEDASGNKITGLGVSLDGTGKIVTLQLKDLNVEIGKYFIVSTSALTDDIGRTADIRIMMNVAKEVILFEEDFEFGYTLNENWINDGNLANATASGFTGDTKNYETADGNWHIQTNGAPTDDFVGVVDTYSLNLGGNFSGNALKLYNSRATSASEGYTAFRRNFANAISLETGDYAGKKLVYEADVILKSNSHDSTAFLIPSRNTKIYEYGNTSYKLAFVTSGRYRIEQSSYWTAYNGPSKLWYRPAQVASADTLKGTAHNLKLVFNQNNAVDTISIYLDNILVTDENDRIKNSLSGHAYDTTQSEFAHGNYQGQAYDYCDALLGIWGTTAKSEIYVDNFKAYLVDELKVTNVEIAGSDSAFETSTDSVVYTFTSEIDETTVGRSITVLDAEGNVVNNAIRSATLEDDGKKLRIVLAKSLAGESTYKVVLGDTIKDIYGNTIANDYVWYEYPIDDYYEKGADDKYAIGTQSCTYIPAAEGVGAKLTNGTVSIYVDCYISKSSTANREISFTTAEQLRVESISPAAIPGYDLGKDQEIIIKFAEVLDDTTDLSTAFTVTDEGGNNITGLSASFGDTKDIVKLQLSGLALGNGKHYIESADGALQGISGLYANVSISVGTVDFMISYAEPGSEVIANYVEGQNQSIILGLSTPTTLAPEEIASAFEVYDEAGVKLEGLTATYDAKNADKTDDDIITLQLSGLVIGKGEHTIKATDKLVDRRGRTLTYEYIFTVLPFTAAYESSIVGYEPNTEKTIDINLSYALSDTSINNIGSVFEVTNSENLKVSGLNATVSEDKKVIKLDLEGLDISGGVYKIVSKTGALVSDKGETLADILITLDTQGEVTGDLSGEGAGSGSPLPEGTSYETKVLLDENFENSTEKAEKGIEFIPYLNWYTSPDKIPALFDVVKTGTGVFKDARVAIVPDPADPSSGNMVLVNNAGYYATDGSVLASAQTVSAPPNYHTVTRALDQAAEITKDPYTVIRMSTRVYVPSSAAANLMDGGSNIRQNSYIISASSSTGAAIVVPNFEKDYTTNKPRFRLYAQASNTSTGATDIQKVFTADAWHTIEFVFTMNKFNNGNLTPSYHAYIDGVLVGNVAYSSSSYDTIDGMVSRLVSTSTRSGAVEVYYDDWKITQETLFRTHVDIPQTNVPEEQKITLTLTKKLDAESIKLVEDSLSGANSDKIITVVDSRGNELAADITFTNGSKIKIEPKYGLKYNTNYIIEFKKETVVNGTTRTLAAEDGEAFAGLTYPFKTAKGLNTYIDAETSASSFNCHSSTMETATRFSYTMNLSGAHDKDIIAAVAVFTGNEELIGIKYESITAGSTQANFDFNTFSGKTGAKIVRMYIWEAKSDGNGGIMMGRLMQLPDEITSR